MCPLDQYIKQWRFHNSKLWHRGWKLRHRKLDHLSQSRCSCSICDLIGWGWPREHGWSVPWWHHGRHPAWGHPWIHRAYPQLWHLLMQLYCRRWNRDLKITPRSCRSTNANKELFLCMPSNMCALTKKVKSRQGRYELTWKMTLLQQEEMTQPEGSFDDLEDEGWERKRTSSI